MPFEAPWAIDNFFLYIDALPFALARHDAAPCGHRAPNKVVEINYLASTIDEAGSVLSPAAGPSSAKNMSIAKLISHGVFELFPLA
ncbi:hypothetical protein [uncultured Limimaricola sp.]|uniref:hypothetical protein n=1 Tax=uncultured Limimaricola sp. TaxID=2211667 RepID=UPI0030F869EB